MVKTKDLSGFRIGKLSVIKRVEDHVSKKSGKKLAKWLVKCDCGYEFGILAHSLTCSKPTKSCRVCAGVKDLSGMRCGNLLVIERDSSNRSGAKWKCKCDCGNFVKVLSSHLQKGETKRCWDCKVNNHKLNGRMSSRVYYRMHEGAKRRSMDVGKDVDRKYLELIYKKQNGKCALTGIDIIFANTVDDDMHGKTTASLDRIKSDVGYIKGNVQWVHKTINKMKMDLDQDLFIKFCCLVWEKSK